MGTNSILNIQAYILFFSVSSSLYETNKTNYLVDISSTIKKPQLFYQEIAEKRDLAIDINNFEIKNNESENLNLILEFSNLIITKSKDIEPEIIEMVNENFWDLI